MNIILINHYAGSPNMGMEYRAYYMAREWSKLGHEVLVIAADFSHLRAKNPVIESDYEERVIEGVKYLLIKTTVYSDSNLKRGRNILDFTLALQRLSGYIAEKYKPDVIIASSTHPFDFVQAKAIAKKSGARVVFELHDLWPFGLICLYGYSKNHPMMRLMEYHEHNAMKKADAVVSILPNVDDYMSERKIKPKQYHYIPNGISTDKLSTEPSEAAKKHIEFLQRYIDKGVFIAMYMGGFAEGNSLSEFVKAAKLCDDNTIFVLIGSGTHKINLKRYAKLNGIENIFFLDRVSKDDVQSVLALADALYIGAKKSELYRYGVGMNKLFDYALSGKMIIYGIESKINPIADVGTSIEIEPDNAEAISKAIEKIKAMDKDKKISIGKKARTYAIENYSYEVLSKKFLDILEGL